MTEDPFRKMANSIAAHLKAVAAAGVSISLIATALWWAFGPRIEQSARDLVGTNELKEIVIQQGTRLDENRAAIDGLSERITSMEPSPAVAEYDVLRSSIDEVCVLGGVCRYTYRVRRTDEGESCGAPSGQRILVDASGTTFFPQASPGGVQPQRITTEWTVVSSAFVVPRRVVPGIAEFALQITYPDCDRDQIGRVVVTEESPHLIFEIDDGAAP